MTDTEKNAEIQPHDRTYRQLAPGLFTWDGDWYKTLFRRRMTLLQLESGGLLVHSAIRLKDADYAQLDSLGKVEIIIAPNALHGDDAPFYKLRYPKARLFAPGALVKQLEKTCTVDEILPQAWPVSLQSELESMEFVGTRILHESVFFHRKTRTLILTDLVFNMRQEQSGLMRTFMSLNKIHQRFGPSRIFRYVFVNNPAQASASLKRILEWDFDRVIMSHGEVLETGGKKAMSASFLEMGLG